MRRWLALIVVCLIALAAAYLLWFRDSSFVRVDEVKVTGAEQAPEVDSALRATAEGQSTLHPDADALRAAVADSPLVAGLKVDTEFPHTMLIDVAVREPVVYLESDGLVLAGDGVVIDHSGQPPEGVPIVADSADGAAGSLAPGDAVSGDALEISRVLGAAPGPFAAEINSAEVSKESGVTVDVGPGLELRFGDATAAPAKWKAATAVLADSGFEGAAYLDLSVPDRPVAGGVPEPSETVPDSDAGVVTAP